MKIARDFIAATILLTAPSCERGTTEPIATGPHTTSDSMSTDTSLRFRTMASFPYDRRMGILVHASLPVLVRRPQGVLVALLCIPRGTMARLDTTPEERARAHQEVQVPQQVHYLDPSTAVIVEDTRYLNERRAAHFGIPDPIGQVLGRFDDPHWPAKDRVTALRHRIYAGLDVLLPLFADEHLPWTEEANMAAREVRDFFPIAAEPGLWPYYRAEGRELFGWLERNAPPGKARMPWEEEPR